MRPLPRSCGIAYSSLPSDPANTHPRHTSCTGFSSLPPIRAPHLKAPSRYIDLYHPSFSRVCWLPCPNVTSVAVGFGFRVASNSALRSASHSAAMCMSVAGYNSPAQLVLLATCALPPAQRPHYPPANPSNTTSAHPQPQRLFGRFGLSQLGDSAVRLCLLRRLARLARLLTARFWRCRRSRSFDRCSRHL
jgi:hypothetical protein